MEFLILLWVFDLVRKYNEDKTNLDEKKKSSDSSCTRERAVPNKKTAFLLNHLRLARKHPRKATLFVFQDSLPGLGEAQ